MMKDRKLGNFNIRDMRESSKKNAKEEPNKTKTSIMSDNDKKRRTTPKIDTHYQLQKQFVKAENLTEQQQMKIRKDAEKLVTKKARTTQVKFQNELIGVLEQECSKVGEELQMQKMQNQRLRFQIAQLRKNIQFLNAKLEGVYREHDHLSKNNDYGKMEKQQLKEEIDKVKNALQRSEEDRHHLKKMSQEKISYLQGEVDGLRSQYIGLQNNLKNVRDEKDEIEEEYDQKCKQYDYVKEQFEERKREWDRMRQEMQSQTRNNLDRKGEKITKYQVQIQSLNQKLKQEQVVRQKLLQKNKDFQRQIVKRQQIIKDMEDQIKNQKKRINDLSILKSSNNTIMNEKLTQLSQENQKLKKNIEMLQTKKGPFIKQEESKPFLFGPEDHD